MVVSVLKKLFVIGEILIQNSLEAEFVAVAVATEVSRKDMKDIYYMCPPYRGQHSRKFTRARLTRTYLFHLSTSHVKA